VSISEFYSGCFYECDDVCFQMCTRINGAAQLVDVLHHCSRSVSQLLPYCGFTLPFSPSLPYVRDITAALVNILAFRVRFRSSICIIH